MTDNLELWDKVCTTDPEYTKKVTFGRSFTAIDPMYQVRKATEHMGVVGDGWGFNVQETLFLPTDQVAIKVRVWRGNKENYIEQWGQNGLYMDNGRTKPDTDCMKKATTDGLTKGLTYFGFNADVFLGKFDDNKYVADLRKEEAAQKKTDEEREIEEAIYDKLVGMIDTITTSAKVTDFENNEKVKDLRDRLFLNNPDLSGKVNDHLKARSYAIDESETACMPSPSGL